MLPPFSSTDVGHFNGLDSKQEDICTLEATVTTGLEEVAAVELREKLSVDPVCCRGRVVFDIYISRVSEVLQMRSIDNVNILLLIAPCFEFSSDREKCFEKIFKFSSAPDWHKGVLVWQKVFGSCKEDPFERETALKDEHCEPKPEIDLRLLKRNSGISGNIPEDLRKVILEKREIESVAAGEKSKGDKLENKESWGPKFRVTCHRVGSIHTFGSPEAARQFGAGINEMFGWSVDLSYFDIEILLSIDQEFVYVGIALTKEPLFKRNITHFGPTNLRASICYNMLMLAKPEVGDIIIDPMCGGATIPMEGALSLRGAFYLGGDNFPSAISRSRKNLDFLVVNKKCSLCVDVAQWDVTRLPLRDQSADVVVTDLPFGKRIGSKVDNRILYFKALVELARVTKVETGRAVLLTYDRRSMTKNLRLVTKLWKNFSTRLINIGGLLGGVFLLRRTGLLADKSISVHPRPTWKSPTPDQMPNDATSD